MKIEEIKWNNFYTNGEIVIFKSKNGKRFLMLTEPQSFTNYYPQKIGTFFIDKGVGTAYATDYYLKGDFRLVKKGEKFYNGSVIVIDSKNVEIYIKEAINKKYDDEDYLINFNELKYEEKREIKNITDLLD